MKILQLASGDLWAGAEVQLYHMVCSLQKQSNVELLIVLLNHGQLEQELLKQGLNVEILDENHISFFNISRKLLRLVKTYQPNVIHTHRIKENIIGGIVAKLYGCKSVRTTHGAMESTGNFFKIKNVLLPFIDKLVGRFLQQYVIAVSEELKTKLLADFSPSKIKVINNSVSIPFIENQAREAVDFIAGNDQINVCFIGRFVSVKRVDLFYEIAKKVVLSENDLNVHFYMIGDGPLWNLIEEKVRDDGLEANIHLIGFVKNTAPYLKNMHLLLFTSEHEGLPMTLLEAMALGVSVVYRDTLTTIRQVLCDGKCGCINSFDNSQSAYNSLLEVLSNSSDRSKKAELAKQQVLDAFSIEKNIHEYIRLYQNVLQRHSLK